MMAKQKTYIAIDLKSFYASVECKERNRDPLTTNLVVADKSRTEKTICLAVSPSLKSYGIPGRPRLFEVVQKVKEANNTRRWKALNRTFTGSSDDSTELNANPALEIDYIVAPPRMAYYLEYSTKIYSVYLKYIALRSRYRYPIHPITRRSSPRHHRIHILYFLFLFTLPHPFVIKKEKRSLSDLLLLLCFDSLHKSPLVCKK